MTDTIASQTARRAIALSLLLLPAAAGAQAPIPAPPPVGAQSHILVDFLSGRTLAAGGADERVEPASITKVMTVYVALKEIASKRLQPDGEAPISERAWRTGGSRMFLDLNSRVGIDELLHGIIIQSGNDASVALAEHVAGSEEAFAGLMNHYAAELGLGNTHYVNASGIPDPEHYSTAADTARLVAAMIRDFPEYYKLYREKSYTYNGIKQGNRNLLLWRDPTVDGVKTGHTESAGYCLAASAERDGMRLIAVVMGAASENARADQALALLNYGFRFFETAELYEPGKVLAEERIWQGAGETLPLGIGERWYLTLPRGRYADLKATMEVTHPLLAPFQAGDQAGRIVVALDGEELGRQPLVALADVPEAGFFGRTYDRLYRWLLGDD